MVLPILISVSPAPGPYWPAVQATPLTNTRLTAERLKAIISFTLMTSSLNPRQCTPMSALPPIADITVGLPKFVRRAGAKPPSQIVWEILKVWLCHCGAMSALPPKADNQTCSEQSKIIDCAERMTKRTHRSECQLRDHRIPRSHRSAGLAGKATSSPLQHCRALLCRPSKRPALRPCGRPAKLPTGPWWNRPPLQAVPSSETLLGRA